MKLTYTTKDGRFTVQLEGSSQKEIFRELARFQEVFEDNAAANVGGKDVSSDSIKYVVRKGKYKDDKGKEKEAEYFEKRIVGGLMNGYQKSYGVLDDGTDGLFPKKAPEEGDYVKGYNGWYLYKKA